jgi:predicted ester cyclase/uncharacterized protein YndB with AHSA1/START domain
MQRSEAMETKTVTQEVFLNAVPHEVFEAYMDDKQHSGFTGSPAVIDRRPGGRFSAYGEQLSGTTQEIGQDRKIVQDWRSSKWPAGHFSRLSLTLSPIYGGRGTQLSLVQTSVPAEAYEAINSGWREHYWNKLGEYLRAKKVAVVRRFLEEFKNRANIEVVDETWTPDSMLHVTGFPLPPGRDAQKNIGRAIFAAFGDVHVEVNDTIVEGDRVVERHTAHAVHRGEFMGIPATGKKVFWTENHIYRIANGRIAETWSEPSFHDLLNQIRGTKSAAQTAD